MKNVGRSSGEARTRRGDRLLAARPPDGPLFPCLELVSDDGKAADFLKLALPDGACRLPMPPLARVVSDNQGARVLRQSRESRLMIPSGTRLRKPINDPADLLRRLHHGSLAQQTTARNRAEDSRRPERQRRELSERPGHPT